MHLYLAQAGDTPDQRDFLGYRVADELGRLRYTLWAGQRGSYVLHLDSEHQKITGPVITVTK